MSPANAQTASAVDPIILSASELSKAVVAPDGTILSILSGASLQVRQGERVAITGASGCGKTTLLCLLAGLDQPDGGEILMMDSPLHLLSQEDRARVRAGRVGFVFQDFQLVPGLTALENVMLPLELARQSEPASTAMNWLDQLSVADRAGNYPPQLSGGERQRVALARAFAPSPKLLFADEPTGNLDEKTGEKLIEILLNPPFDTPPAVVVVTHDRTLAQACDRTLSLAGGVLHDD